MTSADIQQIINSRRNRTIGYVLLASLVIAAGGFWFYRNETREIKREKEEALAAIAELKVSQIHQWREERLGDAARTARSPLVVKTITQILTDPKALEPRADLWEILRINQDVYHYSDAQLITPDGKVLISGKDHPDPTGPQTMRAAAEALARRRPVLSDIYRCPHGYIHLDAVAPVLDESGAPLALVLLRSDADKFLYPLIQSWPTPSPSAETLLIERDGDELIFLNEVRHQSRTALNLRRPLTLTTLPAVQAVQGRTGPFEGLDYRGVEVLAELRPVPDSPWFMVSKVDRSEIMAEARFRTGVIVGFTVLFIVLAGAFGALADRERRAGLFRDLYRTEMEKNEAREQFRATLYSIGDGVLVTDREGKVQQLNPVAEALTGWSEAEARGKPIEEVFNIICESTRDRVSNPVERVLREGKVVGLANHTLLISRDGTERPVADSGAPVRGKGGSINGVVLVFRDQTEERRAHENLRQAEEKFRSFFDNAPIGKCITSLEGEFIRVNPALGKILGRPIEELQGTSFASLTHPEDQEKSQRTMEFLLSGERESQIMEKRYLAPDGREIWTLVHLALQRDGQGRPLHFITHVQDITRHKLAETALRQSEERFSTIFQSSPAAVALTSLRDQCFSDVNQAWQQLTGYSREQVLGRTPAEFDLWVDASQRERMVEALRQGEREMIEVQVRSGSGEVREVLMAARLLELGDEPYVLTMAQDITDRKRVEKALLESEHKYKSLIENFEDIIFTIDLTGKVTFASPATKKVLGYESEQTIGMNLLDFLPESEKKRALETIPQGMAGQKITHYQTPALTRDGRTLILELTFTRVYRDGRVIGAQAIAKDVTDRQRAEAELQAALHESSRSAADLQSMLRAARAVIGSHSFEETARLIFDECRAVTGATSGYVALLSDDGRMNEVLFLEAGGEPCEVDPELPMPIRGLRAQAYRKQMVVVENNFLESRWNELMPPGHLPLRNVLFAPLVIGDTAVGVIGLANKPGDFTDHDMEIAAAMGDFAAIALKRSRAEEALKASEERFRSMIEEAPEAIFIQTQGRFAYVNPAAARLWGGLPSELAGQPVLPCFHPDFREQVEQRIRNLNSDWASVPQVEEKILKLDGTSADVEVSTIPFTFHGENGALVFVRDITERKRMEEEREQSSRWLIAENDLISRLNSLQPGEDAWAVLARGLREVLGAATAWVCRFDHHTRTLMVKHIDAEPEVLEKITAFLGANPENLTVPVDENAHAVIINEPVVFLKTLTEVTFGQVPPEVSQALQQMMGVDYFIGLANVMEGELYGTTIVGLGPGQTAPPVDLLTSLAHTTATSLSRWRAEEAMRKSEERYRLIADNTADIISVNDLKLNFTYVSPSIQRLRGFTVDEARQQTLEQVMTPETLSRVQQVFVEEMELEARGTADPDRTRTLELEEYRKDGTTVWVEAAFSFIRDPDQKPIGILSVTRDISERKRMEKEHDKLEEQLRQSQKMEAVGRLAGGVAHDFNNQLSVIMTYADLAKRASPSPSQIQEDLDEVLGAAHRSADLTRQLLAFARKQTVEPKVLDLNDTVGGMLKMLRRLIGEDINLAWMPGVDLWRIKIDPAQVDQILANLCVNARDAITGAGRVTIQTMNATIDADYSENNPGVVPGRYVMLAVSDDGEGIDKGVIQNIFEPFFTTKEQGKGTGLGLATVYGVVKQNNGFINVYSEPGRGTTFKIYLPRQEGEEAEKKPDTVPFVRGGTETILLCEDELEILTAGKRLLEKLNYRVLPANSPHRALELADEYEGEIDLLITDVIMPKMNGSELVSALHDIRPGLKCLYMSGYTADVISHHGVLEPGVRFISKPFTMETLAAKVREILDA